MKSVNSVVVWASKLICSTSLGCEYLLEMDIIFAVLSSDASCEEMTHSTFKSTVHTETKKKMCILKQILMTLFHLWNTV